MLAVTVANATPPNLRALTPYTLPPYTYGPYSLAAAMQCDAAKANPLGGAPPPGVWAGTGRSRSRNRPEEALLDLGCYGGLADGQCARAANALMFFWPVLFCYLVGFYYL